MKSPAIGLAAACLILLLLSPVAAENRQVVSGAGPATKVTELFFARLPLPAEARDYTFVVPPISTKHAGGIANTDAYLFGRTGRPLNDKEQALNKREIFLAKVPIAFASGEDAKLASLSFDNLRKIYLGEIGKWSELGGPDIDIVTVGREPSEAMFMELQREFPFFRTAKFDVVFKTDDEVVNFLKSPVGKYAIAFGAKPNFEGLTTLTVKGTEKTGVRLGLVYDQKNEADPVVKAAVRFAASEAWRQAVAGEGLIPVN